MGVKRCFVLGQPVDAVDFSGALQFIESYVDSGACAGTVLAVNPEKIITLKHSRFLSDFFRKSVLLIPDGIGVVFALRMRGERVQRVPGADLMQAVCDLAARRGFRVFIYGGSESVSFKACSELTERYPGIDIVGRCNGYVKDDEQDLLIEQIDSSGAQILFVALGSPRQEEWMSKYINRLSKVSIVQGVGGTLDTIAGTVKRAPIAWQNLHLEWFYRLLKQPTRAPRQLKLIKFIWDVMREEALRRYRGVK